VSAVTAQLCALTHADLVVTLTETSIMDLSDVVPASIEAAGGEITCYGAPVEPGNLLLLGEIGSTMVLGAPGCIRGLARNVVDLVLPRLFARLPTTATDIYAFANGGLLDTKERV
jgi:molybdenum cofactor cytidylyltransferase